MKSAGALIALALIVPLRTVSTADAQGTITIASAESEGPTLSRQSAQAAAHSADNRAACSRTVSVAFSCLSGG
jgi:hypothetical protein